MFLLAKLLTWLFLIPGILILFLIIAIIFIIKNKKRLALFFIFLTILIIYFLSITPVKNLLLIPLEYSYNYPDFDKTKIEALVILGGGIRGPSPDTNNKFTLSNQSFQRVFTAYKIWKLKKIPIIVTGGKFFGALESEAKITLDILEELGVSKDYILLEDQSKNTIENAINSKKIILARQFKNIGIITSAYHLKRSVIIFNSLNIANVPIPTDFYYTEQRINITFICPDIENLRLSYIAIHEHVGIIYVKIVLKIYKLFRII